VTKNVKQRRPTLLSVAVAKNSVERKVCSLKIGPPDIIGEFPLRHRIVVLKLAVIIPTWQRVRKLEACLTSLAAQSLAPDLVLVVARAEDAATHVALEEFRSRLPLEVLVVHSAGVVHAENAAIARLRAQQTHDLVAFLDDDAAAPPGWVAHIQAFFASHSSAAALGGGDIIASEPWSYHDHPADDVGRVKWYGKVVGNHHRKAKGVREVESLKGVNMVVRREQLRPLDHRLQGSDPRRGNGVFWELDLCLGIRGRGGRIFFDPSLLVLHDSDHRSIIPEAVIESTAHNLVLVLRKHLPAWRLAVAWGYFLVIGNAHVKGLGRTIVDWARGAGTGVWRACWVSLRGARNGWLVAANGHDDPEVLQDLGR
jgi:GT2 family glycosyltransferase